MRNHLRAALRTIIVAVIACAAAPAPAKTILVTTLDDPNGPGTNVCGLYGGTYVGYYGYAGHEADGTPAHGFRYDGSTWTTLDHPSAPGATWMRGIWGNNIVGYYLNQGYHGFKYDGSSWTTLNYPSAFSTRAYGIWGNTTVGYYQDSINFQDHGFTYDGVTWKTLDYPGAIQTIPTGIYNNTIVGIYYSATAGPVGFRYDGSTWTTVPGAATAVYGNTIVGNYTSNNFTSGFTYDGTTFTLYNTIGSTEFEGISGSTVVGNYISELNTRHGFVASLPEPASLSFLSLTPFLLSTRRRPRASI